MVTRAPRVALSRARRHMQKDAMADQRTPPPSTVPWPPIIYVAAVIAAVVLQVAFPLAFPESTKAPLALLGLIGLAGGIGLVITAIRALNAAHTTVRPT